MPIITKIISQKKRPRFNIHVDGRYAFSLSSDLLVKFSLSKGQEISSDDLAGFFKGAVFSDLYESALRFLSFRPRSEKEVSDYLKGRIKNPRSTRNRRGRQELRIKGFNFGDEVVEGVIGKLREKNLVNDREFVGWWLDQRSKFKPRGKMFLLSELIKKGVEKNIASSIIEEKIDEKKLVLKLFEKRKKTYSRFSRRKFRRKMGRYLASYGFSWSVIREVIDKFAKKR